ncbi:MAG: type II toxin-antitoxin system RelE/ParE family toxin [Terriglobales bacterium]
MRIRWTPAAAVDLQNLSNYLKDHHPHYRQPTVRKVYAAVQSLKEWPHRGRVGREEGTRELLFPPLPYIAVYRVKGQSIEVLRIYHGAQDRG